MAPSTRAKKLQRSTGATSKPALVFRKSARKARTDGNQDASPFVANGANILKPATKRAIQATAKSTPDSSKPLKSALNKPRTAEKIEEPTAACRPKASVQTERRTVQKVSPRISGSKPKPKPALSRKPKAPAENVATMTWIHQPPPASSFRIIAGSYERLLYGLRVTQTSTSAFSTLDLELEPIFQFPAHPSSIKCLATAGHSSKWLVTAGSDELVKIWDLRRKKEVGSLSGAEGFGPPTFLDFPLSSHLLLAAEGVILLYRTRDWALLHIFKGHVGHVNFVSTHPSAKLALSGGQDGVLRAWDLTRGKSLGGTKMGMGDAGEMQALRWFGQGDGNFFALLGRTVVRIFRRNMSEVARIGSGTKTGMRLNDVAVWDLDRRERPKGLSLILVAREDKRVGVYLFDRQVFDELDRQAAERKDVEDEEGECEEEEEAQRTLMEMAWLRDHDSRVKAISLQPLCLPGSTDPVLTATTISSDGRIRIFDLSKAQSRAMAYSQDTSSGAKDPIELNPTAIFDTKGARLTSLSVVGGDGLLGRAAQRAADDDGDDDSTRRRRSGSSLLSESEYESEHEGDDGLEDEESELRRLEEILRDAQCKGIDLDELVRMEQDGDMPSDEKGDGDDCYKGAR